MLTQMDANIDGRHDSARGAACASHMPALSLIDHGLETTASHGTVSLLNQPMDSMWQRILHII